MRIFALRAETPASFPQYFHSCKSHFPGAPAGVCTLPSRAFPANQFQCEFSRDPGQRNRLDLPDSLSAAMRESGLAAKSSLPSCFWEHFLKSHLLPSPFLSLHLPGVTVTGPALPVIIPAALTAPQHPSDITDRLCPYTSLLHLQPEEGGATDSPF